MKKIICFVMVICIISSFCKKNPANFEKPMEQEIFLEDIYQDAIVFYEDATLLNESFEMFNLVIERDSCGCFWDSYIYLSNIHLKWEDIEKAKEVLLRGYLSIYSLPEKIDHIKEKRLSALTNRLQEIISYSSSFPDSFFVVNSDTNIRFVPYDAPAEPIGGYAEIQRNIQYPKNAIDQGIEGRVVVFAHICWCGRVCKTRISQGLELESLNYEARRVLHNTKWKPALQRDKIVETWVAVPIDFKID